jgi:hypothetical protein
MQALAYRKKFHLEKYLSDEKEFYVLSSRKCLLGPFAIACHSFYYLY